MFSGLVNYPSIKFKVDINSSSSFESSPELLNSLFQNLIQNAIKYSKNASSDHAPYVDINIKAYQEEVIIKICDNGLGINKKSINKIFDLYFRENNGGVSGNGLGLYIVKNIVEDLNGKIKVTSDQKNGTCFKITLPNTNHVNK